MSPLLEDAQIRLQNACKLLQSPNDVYTHLSTPQTSILVSLPVKMDDERLEIFEGNRVIHSTALGPAKGGLIISDQFTDEDIFAFALMMTLKCALVKMPMGGSCGLIKVNPKTLSDQEFEGLIRRYTSAVINTIGPKKDIIGPDINAHQRVMSWIYDTYSMSTGKYTAQIVTGKPLNLGGIVGREEAVGMGISMILHELSRVRFEEIRGQKVVVQGIGNVGQNFAKTTTDLGAHVIAISDSSTGIYNYDGLDISDVINYKQKHGSLVGYPKAEKISNQAMLELDCDYLIPCATHSQIHKDNVDKLHCRRIIEGANAAITYDAERVLWQRDIPVIPDILANAGGVIVSYLEWVANIQSLTWDLDQVMMELKRKIVPMFYEVFQLRTEKDISYRVAAHQIALKRLITARSMRGIYP
jgi:glutamate dehydrogenase (NAD(P)+)